MEQTYICDVVSTISKIKLTGFPAIGDTYVLMSLIYLEYKK